MFTCFTLSEVTKPSVHDVVIVLHCNTMRELFLVSVANGYLASGPIEPNTTVTIWIIDFIWIEITFSIDTNTWITILQVTFKQDFELFQSLKT